MPAKIEISWKTIVFTIFFIILLNFLWTVRDLIFSLFIAFILVSALKPPVLFLEKKKIPRSLAAFFIFLSFLFIVMNLFLMVIPQLVGELTYLVKNLPIIIRSISPNLSPIISLDSLTQYLPDLTNQLINIIRGIFSNTIFVISTLFFVLYLLLEENLLEKTLVRFMDKNQAQKIIDIFYQAEKRMNAWFWGEIILMSVVGVMTFIGLNLIGMKYALALAVLAGILEIVPNLGPVLSAIPAFLIGLSQSFLLGISNLALYFIVQQLENNAIVPLVMKKAVGLNPIITLIALIVGGKLAGVLGVLLAIPTTLFLETILIETIKNK